MQQHMRETWRFKSRPAWLITLAALAVIMAAAAFSLAQAGRKEKAVDTPEGKGAAAASLSPRLSPPEAGVIDGATVQRDAATGRIARVRGQIVVPGAQTPEQAAERFLRANAKTLGLNPNLSDLRPERSVASLTGHHITYQQTLKGFPVLGGLLQVHTNRNLAVTLVNNGTVKIKGELRTAPLGDPGKAIAAALAALKPDTPPTVPPTASPAVLVQNDLPALVWNVHVDTRKPAGAWEVLVSIPDGKVVSMVNRARFVDGDGMVFIPNPVATSGQANLADNNDADSTTLTNQRIAVKLRDLDGSGLLQGPFCTTAPTDQQPRANEPDLNYNYLRSDDRFEEVMCYYHIDAAQRHIQSLGFTNVNNRQQGMNVNGTTEDNAWYSPWTGDITMGTGGVDDAEDAHVIWHEYGHAIQDNQVPGFGASHEAGSMGEGFGDYWALTTFTGIGPHAPDWDVYVATWDATSYNPGNPAYLRRVDGTKHYPEDMQGEVHADGEIWSACLWQIRGIVGAERADTMILESHFRLMPDASFEDGALAILGANTDLYGGADQSAIAQVFVDRGILTDPRIIDLVVDSIAAKAGQAVTIKATMTRRYNGAAVAGKEVVLAVDGTEVARLTTNADGVVEAPFTVPADAPPGQAIITADFAGDDDSFPASGQAMLYVLETASISGSVTDSGTGMDGVPVILTALAPTAGASPNLPIPDGDPAGVTTEVELRSTGTVGSVTVSVNIAHTWIGDLKVALIHPDGTTVLLHNETGGSADNIITTYPTLTSPAESLDVLAGKPIAGVWKLWVADGYTLDTGTIRSWSLSVERQTPLVVNTTTDADGNYTASDLEAGTWRVRPDNGRSAFLPAYHDVTIGPSQSGVNFALNSFTIAGTVTAGSDPLPDALVTLTSPADKEISAWDSPGIPIPDYDTTGIESPIVITDVGTIKDIRVGVNITHPYIADLEVSLIHPDGTRLRLHNRTGGSADDIITSYPDQTRPAESLAALIGKPVQGTWKLRVRDLNIADVGVLNAWGLDIAFSGFADRTTTTNADGTYSFADCIGGTHTVKVAKDWMEFTPAEAVVVVGPHRYDVDFEANVTRTVLTVAPVEGERGATVNLQATLMTDANDPVAGQTIAFSVDGNAAGEGVTDASGVASVPYTIAADAMLGDAVVTADFAGANPYWSSSGTGVLTVKGPLVKLFGPDRTGVIGTTVDLRAFLFAAEGNVPLEGKTIAFDVNGTNVGDAVTSATGRASLPYVIDVPAGTVPLTFRFAGDMDYSSGTGSATLTALHYDTSIIVSDQTGTIARSVDLRAWLYAQPGSTPLPGKTVAFTVDGTAAGSAVTSTTGRALVRYAIPDAAGGGTRAIQASFAGDPGYTAVSGTATLTVNRAPVYIWTTAKSVKQGQPVVLRAYVRRLPDYQWLPSEPITFAVEGTDVGTADTDASGVARFTYLDAAGMAPGTYGFTATFAGNAWVAPGSGSGLFTIVP
jgi:subtilisin-like proprotein convertase family protein/Zn-dependent metalloprotease